jgi:Cu/Ag efflux protein CusF
MGLANYDGLTTQFVVDANAANAKIHAGNRHFTSASKAKVGKDCSTAKVTITHGKL